jgi:hypothetical protein
VLVEVPRQRERRGAGVDHDHRVVLDQLGRGRPDLLLRRRLESQADVQSRVRARHGGETHRSTVRADHHAVRIQLVEIPTDGV